MHRERRRTDFRGTRRDAPRSRHHHWELSPPGTEGTRPPSDAWRCVVVGAEGLEGAQRAGPGERRRLCEVMDVFEMTPRNTRLMFDEPSTMGHRNIPMYLHHSRPPPMKETGTWTNRHVSQGHDVRGERASRDAPCREGPSCPSVWPRHRRSDQSILNRTGVSVIGRCSARASRFFLHRPDVNPGPESSGGGGLKS